MRMRLMMMRASSLQFSQTVHKLEVISLLSLSQTAVSSFAMHFLENPFRVDRLANVLSG